jgi:hypothetical protein
MANFFQMWIIYRQGKPTETWIFVVTTSVVLCKHNQIRHCEEAKTAVFAVLADEAISSFEFTEEIASVVMTAKNAVTPASQ